MTILPPNTIVSSFGEDHEPPGWLRVATAMRMVDLEDEGVPLDGSRMLLSRLVEHGVSREIDDRTCDRCGQYQAPPAPFVPGLYRPERWLALVFGLCAQCAAAYAVPTVGAAQ